MTKKTITINGKQYPVIFTLKTLSNFEEATNQGFFESKFNKTSDRMALIMSAVFAADKDSDLTVDDLKGKEDWDSYIQINNAYAVVMELASEFFPIPEVEKGKDPDPKEDGQDEGKPKN